MWHMFQPDQVEAGFDLAQRICVVCICQSELRPDNREVYFNQVYEETFLTAPAAFIRQ